MTEATSKMPPKDKAACRGQGADLFFSDTGPMSDSTIRKAVTKAKSICKTCEIQAECLMFAVNNGEEFGIWGGFTSRERKKFFGENVSIDINKAMKAAVWTRNL